MSRLIFGFASGLSAALLWQPVYAQYRSGAVAPEAGDGCHDEARMLGEQRVVIEPALGEHTWAVVLDEDVGAAQQAARLGKWLAAGEATRSEP